MKKLDRDITKQIPLFVDNIIKDSMKKVKPEDILPQPKKKWTFLVYMAGDNNLEAAGIDDINEMEEAGGSSDDINVVVQFDRISRHDSSNKDWTSTKRFYIKDGRTSDLIESLELMDLGETNCGNPEVLKDFLTWGAKNFPAEHYAVIIWNHGSGWKEDDIYRRFVDHRKIILDKRKSGHRVIKNFNKSQLQRVIFISTIFQGMNYDDVRKSIGYDDSNRDFLDNKELQQVLSYFNKIIQKKVDILGMDACMMAMIEVAYQNKDYIEYMVASEETEPGDGWPYHQIIKILNSNPKLTPEDFSKMIVDEYIDSYPDRTNVTQSSISTKHLDKLTNSISDLAVSLTDNIDLYSSELKEIIRNVKSYYDYDYVDLKNFVELVNVYIPELSSKVNSVINDMKNVIIASGGNGEGLSIYLPKYQYGFLYDKLDWAQNSKWDEFIKQCLFRGLLVPTIY